MLTILFRLDAAHLMQLEDADERQKHNHREWAADKSHFAYALLLLPLARVLVCVWSSQFGSFVSSSREIGLLLRQCVELVSRGA